MGADTVGAALHESWAEICKRIVSIYPYFLAANLIGLVLHFLGYDGPPIKALARCIFIPFDCCFLSISGFPIAGVIGVSWYLSALFFALWVLLPVAMRRYKLCIYAAPVLGALVLGAFGRAFGNLDVVDDPVGPIYGGVIRAFVALDLGMLACELSEKLRAVRLTAWGRRAVTLMECFLWTAVLGGMFIWSEDLAPKLDQIVVFFTLCALTVTTSGQSLLYEKFDWAPVYACGRLTMVLFMNHAAWINYWPVIARRFGMSLSYKADAALALVFAVASSVLILYAGKAIKNAASGLRRSLIWDNGK